MGNQPLNQEVQAQIKSLKLVKKQPHYCILKSPDQTEFIKFLYTPLQDQSAGTCSKPKKISIFDQKYLEYRWQSQNKNNAMGGLPKIWAIGQEPQTESLISCTASKINFAIFQHPTNTLRHQIEKRITSEQPFKQWQFLTLIRTVVTSLSNLFDHVKDWNEELLEKNPFFIKEDNIYIDHRGEFIVSDMIGHFKEIEQLSKHEVTLKKSSRANSLTNLHAKTTGKKVRSKYFQSNLSNLASIVEGINFKFFSLNSECKSGPQSQSLSTALSTYRSTAKKHSFSFQFEQLLKDLREDCQNHVMIIEKADKMLNAIHLPTPIQKSGQFSAIASQKSIIEQMTLEEFSNSINHFTPISINAANLRRMPLQELAEINENKEKQQNQLQQKLNKSEFQPEKSLDGRFLKNKTHVYSNFSNCQTQNEQGKQKKGTKLRLSLKKDSNEKHSLQKKSVSQSEEIKNQLSSKLLLCRSIEKDFKGKQNMQVGSEFKQIENKYKNNKYSQSSMEKITQKLLKVKLLNSVNRQNMAIPKSKKVVLKNPNLQKQNENSGKCQQSETSSHLNPMPRKKAFKMSNKLQNFKSSQKGQTVSNYKTNMKSNEMDLDVIENLSSIVSNQNNTISSYGIAITEEFKTQDSVFEDQGYGELGENDVSDLISEEKIDFEFPQISDSKKKMPKSNALNIKLSSYLSMRLGSESIERPQDKIPEFLKQYKLPEKNLMTLNNRIMNQKDMIVEESFEQSELNSIRHSYPNILSFQYS